MKKIYLAYGSNMCRKQMEERCPETNFLKTVRLVGFEFLINSRGVATVIRNSDSYIEGVLWELTQVCEEELDRREGVSYGTYRKEYIDIEKVGNVLTYIASDFVKGPPRNGYLELICTAAEREGLSEEYIGILRGQF